MSNSNNTGKTQNKYPVISFNSNDDRPDQVIDGGHYVMAKLRSLEESSSDDIQLKLKEIEESSRDDQLFLKLKLLCDLDEAKGSKVRLVLNRAVENNEGAANDE